jgi:hypothetical protein
MFQQTQIQVGGIHGLVLVEQQMALPAVAVL